MQNVFKNDKELQQHRFCLSNYINILKIKLANSQLAFLNIQIERSQKETSTKMHQKQESQKLQKSQAAQTQNCKEEIQKLPTQKKQFITKSHIAENQNKVKPSYMKDTQKQRQLGVQMPVKIQKLCQPQILQTIQICYLQIFKQQHWPQYLPKKYLIKAFSFHLDQEDTLFLIDDCTNPDYTKFKILSQIDKTIKQQLNGQAFLKIQGRTAKDINKVMNKILNTQDLTMAVKMSQFLTQALDQELQFQKQQFNKTDPKQNIGLNIILREYKSYLQTSQKQYRIYLMNKCCVGICQKNPDHLSEGVSQYQISKAKQVCEQVSKAVQKVVIKKGDFGQSINAQIAIDCFISQDGKKAKILGIQPIYPLNSLSLFRPQELKEAYASMCKNSGQINQAKPLTKLVTNQSQYKEVDLSHYRLGSELADKQALQQWKLFIKDK